MEKRFFIGLFLTNSDQLLLSNQINVRHLDKIRIVPSQSYHITLLPPFFTNNETPLISKLNSLNFNPFTVTLTTITTGPKPQKPRLIWACGNPVQELTQLRELLFSAVSSVVDTTSIELKRLLIPHVTLVRFYGKRTADVRLHQTINLPLYIDHFTLIESQKDTLGVHYSIRHQFYA